MDRFSQLTLGVLSSLELVALVVLPLALFPLVLFSLVLFSVFSVTPAFAESTQPLLEAAAAVAEGEVSPTTETVPSESLTTGEAESANVGEAELPLATEQEAEEAKVIVADAENASISVFSDRVVPRRLQVEPGTTIAWINNSELPVKVRFTGKAVSTTCKAPRGFSVGKAGVYVSSEIKKGAVVSLCFLEPELYVYEISYIGTEASVTEAGRTLVGSIQVVK